MKNHGVPQELIDREFEVNTRYRHLLRPQSSAAVHDCKNLCYIIASLLQVL